MYLILYEDVSLGMFDYLRRKMFYSFKLAYFYTQKYILLNFENEGNRYNEIKCPMSRYQGQLKGTRFTMKIRFFSVLQRQGV